MSNDIGYFHFRVNNQVTFFPFTHSEVKTGLPTGQPTLEPSFAPTLKTTTKPTGMLSSEPSAKPTLEPSFISTDKPTVFSSSQLTSASSSFQTSSPSAQNQIEKLIIIGNTTNLVPETKYIFTPDSIGGVSDNAVVSIVSNPRTSIEFKTGNYSDIKLVFRNVTYENNNEFIIFPFKKSIINSADWNWQEEDLSIKRLSKQVVPDFSGYQSFISKSDSPACVFKAKGIPEIIITRQSCSIAWKIIKTVADEPVADEPCCHNDKSPNKTPLGYIVGPLIGGVVTMAFIGYVFYSCLKTTKPVEPEGCAINNALNILEIDPIFTGENGVVHQKGDIYHL